MTYDAVVIGAGHNGLTCACYQHGVMRPIPEIGQFRAPVANVYLCGAGSHPGSGVSMGRGYNAAKAACDDLGLRFSS